MIALLGAMSDPGVAKKLLISVAAVERERLRRRIPPFNPKRPPYEWNFRSLSLLGTDSDRAVAAELGISINTVSRKRRILEIPPAFPQRPKRGTRPWTPREERLLGKSASREVARRLRRSIHAVELRRRQLEIPPFHPARRDLRWSKHWLARLGKDTDAALAARMGVSEATIARKRKLLGISPRFEKRGVVVTPELKRLLRLPQSIVRKRTGLNYLTVRKLRKEHHIPEPPPVVDLPWTKAARRKLGRVTDREMALALGVCQTAVRKRRLRAGIPPSRAWRRYSAAEKKLLLSALPGRELADRLGRSLETIQAARAYYRRLERARPERPRPSTR